jgi:hypothetical protein
LYINPKEGKITHNRESSLMGHSVTGEPDKKVHEHRELRVLYVSLHELAFVIASLWECMYTRMHG